jgi:hypothetical protein
MGAQPSRSTPQELEYYAIRLRPEQSVLLYGFVMAKTTLTWRDTLVNAGINLKSCCECGVEATKLCRMQPDIREWLRAGKARIEDCAYMGPWKPDVFNDLRCNIGDLVVHRKHIGPELLISGGVTFVVLKERYGLTPEIMALLKYSSSDWLELQVPSQFWKELTDEQWVRIFGATHNRCNVIEAARKKEAGGG